MVTQSGEARLSIACVVAFFLLVGCGYNKRYAETMERLRNMPPQDFSYVVQPVFADSEDVTENKLKELYSAEECSVAAIGIHKIDETTNENADERYWLKTVLVNPRAIVFPMDSMNLDRVGEEIARFALKDVVNADKYDFIQVTIVQTGGQGVVQSLKVNLFYRLPGFEVTTLGKQY